ncbi:MAG: MFS transporter [Puniceicoccales bacterium]|jgi:fucose permease|nr:MFS transporter [Puniceicoccales bacterium]
MDKNDFHQKKKQGSPEDKGSKKPSLISPGYILTFALVTLLFFLWAFPNILNDVLIKQFEKSLELSSGQTSFLPFALKTGYFFLAIPAGLFMQRWGYKTGILVGLLLFAFGCVLFYPAALSHTYLIFLGGIFVMAAGCAFLEIGANSFVVALGDNCTSERRLNLAQSFNPIGGIAAAALGTIFIFSGIEPKDHTVALWKAKPAHEVYAAVQSGGSDAAATFFTTDFFDKTTHVGGKKLATYTPPPSQEELMAWTKFFSQQRPTGQVAEWEKTNKTAYDVFLEAENKRVFPTYLTLACAALLIALIMWKARFPELDASRGKFAASVDGKKGSFRELLRFPHWWGAILSQFFYLGAQLGTWSFLIIYVQNNSSLGEKQAGAFLVANMILFMLGRFLSTYFMKYVRPQRLMGFYACVNIGLVAMAIMGSRWAAVKYEAGLHNVVLPLPFAGAEIPFSGGYSVLSTPLPIGIYALSLTTIFMSLMYPTNFASGMKGLGPNAKLGASILVMSLIGGALLSMLMGQIRNLDLAQLPGMGVTYRGEIAPGLIIPIIAYCVIAWYAFVGSRPRGPLYEV